MSVDNHSLTTDLVTFARRLVWASRGKEEEE